MAEFHFGCDIISTGEAVYCRTSPFLHNLSSFLYRGEAALGASCGMDCAVAAILAAMESSAPSTAAHGVSCGVDCAGWRVPPSGIRRQDNASIDCLDEILGERVFELLGRVDVVEKDGRVVDDVICVSVANCEQGQTLSFLGQGIYQEDEWGGCGPSPLRVLRGKRFPQGLRSSPLRLSADCESAV